MTQPPEEERSEAIYTARASLVLLAFGLAVLAFLVAIDRPHWFSIKPVSGTAAAMAISAQPAATTRGGLS
ncbi:hypothetical protein [Sphingomonas dokdonensis]|uniref:Uncharacterized protein n=1 Tax=Sphingomonas dokdonensis TaxID=344880 RepID=A0A245ZL45_9SPHN|nr:hypothetical protein [Sphingomonas dokdonensis]OWK30443.1 hypothetical protein SPDO_21300 [Sphingomonas dokdonensis]